MRFPHSSKKERLVHSFDQLNLYKINRQQLPQFSKFVFDIYARHYLKKHQWAPDFQVFNQMKKSDQEQFSHSVYFGFKDLQDRFLGTIKATKRSNGIRFPIEYEFSIDLEQLCAEKNLVVDDIWHLGRLAIDSEQLRNQQAALSSKQILRLLLIHSLQVINERPNNLMIAESDVLIYQIFRNLGINMQIIGALKDCLGSPTYPVMVTGKDIAIWLQNNRSNEEQPQEAIEYQFE